MLKRMPSNSSTEENLANVLERARTAGFLGPGPLRAHSDHAHSFSAPIPATARTLLDLGSGGGVPGIPLFVRLPHLRGVLLDASEKRCAFLTWAVAALGIEDRVEIRRGRAEELGHESELRTNFDVVTCRGFGPPSATIEGAVGFLAVGGVLIISEPPEGRQWSVRTLSDVGLSQIRLSAGPKGSSEHLPEGSLAVGGLNSDFSTDQESPVVGGTRPELVRPRSGSHLELSEPVSPALVVAFECRGPVPDNLPRPLRKQRSRPLKVLVSDE